MNDLDQFNLSSNSSDFMSLDSSQHALFKQVDPKKVGGTRYSTISVRSEGELGGESADDISIGEIRFPGSTLKQNAYP